MLTLTPKRSRLTCIGLDVSATAVRAAQLRRAGDVWTVVHAGESRRASAAPDTGDGNGDASSIEQGIRDCIQRADFRGRQVICALCPPDIDLHALGLPDLSAQPENQVDDIVHWEIKRLTSPETGEIETSHWRLPEGTRGSPNIIGVATSQASVALLSQRCRGVGLDCIGIDASPCALARAASTLAPREQTDVWGVLDLGHRQSRLLICMGHTPVLARSAGSGGEEWTQRLAEELKLSDEAAEVHKCDHGIAPSRRGARREPAPGAPRSELASILFGVLRQTLTKLVAEIERSYSYVLGCYPSGVARDLIIVGGGAATHQLPEYLGDNLGITVRRASSYLVDSPCRLRCDIGSGTGDSPVREPFERYMTAIGLAMESDPK